MGPLVPFVFSPEFGLLLAVFIGIGFGFVLEQAGFSSTKKLVGLFYGYDFTVLRVFFTAGVTAMIGVLLLGHYGLLNTDVIYINPTFLRSAIVGGLIMGIGFVLGGFCPGTSVCAASIGKLDAMAFILGSILGIYAFGEAYPMIKDFYMADKMGPLKISDFFGMSDSLFAFVLTFIAIAAFYFTWKIENKVNHRSNYIDPKTKLRYQISMVVPFLFIAIIAFLPGKYDIIQNRIAKAKEQKKCVFHEIAPDKLADEIANHYYEYNIIDVRSPEEFEAYHLPLAINIPFENIQNREWEQIFKQKLKKNVFYADNDTLVKMSCLKAKYIGSSTNMILNVSSQHFRNMFFEIAPPPDNATKEEQQTYVYRSQTAKKMNNLVEALQNIGKPVKREIKAVSGGCS
ncbi:YeeE/YedE thiosulfate transporter family protein [Saccharicrinis sp. FJH62]|uniref:YeeE/YedE thiosulfate transporter family protein n=1 Tax=Saccharicrinis sp. FJH62 TaxID=3344657 RepID=UPI0035D42DC5